MQSTIKTHYTAQEKATAAIRNEAMHKEINANKVNIDSSVFIKTAAEKIALKKAKISAKIENTVLRNEFIKELINSSPNFGSLKFIVN
jgi:predicted secreted protein